MTTTVTASPESPLPSQPIAPVVNPATRPFYWAVRARSWENRSLYIAPLAAGCLGFIGFVMSTVGLPERRRAVLLLSDIAQQRARIEWPYDMVAVMLMFTSFIVGVFYCLDALHGERRDRSILFWKSLPGLGSHNGAFEAKHPARRSAATHLRCNRRDADTDVGLDGHAAVSQWPPAAHFGAAAVSPIMARAALRLHRDQTLARAALRLAVARLGLGAPRDVPLGCLADLAIAALEAMAFQSRYFLDFVKYRLFGGMSKAFAFNPNEKHPTVDFHQLTPGEYLTTPGLWLGLIFAAAVVVGIVHLRRSRGPL
jgi:ABC-2 type transport system permease protein